MTPSWYDVLGVEPEDDTATIRDAFRAAIADLDPTDRRFRLLSRGAEVLLDPERRAAHDAELAAQEVDETDDDLDRDVLGPARSADVAPAVVPPYDDEATDDPDDPDEDPDDDPGDGSDAGPAPAGAGERGLVGVRTVAVLAVLALVLAVATAISLVNGGAAGSEQRSADALPDSRQVAAARAAAESAIVPVLSYDYRHLEEDKQKALGFVTPAFGEELNKIFDGVISENSPSTQTVVKATLLASGISRTGPGRVDVVLFVDQSTTNVQVTTPEIYKNQVLAQMVDVDGSWLVDCLVTTPDGGCDRSS